MVNIFSTYVTDTAFASFNEEVNKKNTHTTICKSANRGAVRQLLLTLRGLVPVFWDPAGITGKAFSCLNGARLWLSSIIPASWGYGLFITLYTMLCGLLSCLKP